MTHSQRRRHGSIVAGRLTVAAGCLLVLGANALVFKESAGPPDPLPVLKVLLTISLLWIFAGGVGMCLRMAWMRFVALTMLYVGSLCFFLAGVMTISMDDGPLKGRLQPIFIATGVYLIVSLVFTHSRDVRRLTSRAFE